MEESELLAYVNAAARLARLPLDTQRAAAVAQHLSRTAALAQLLEQAPLAAEDEPAEIYCPAPFPAQGGAA